MRALAYVHPGAHAPPDWSRYEGEVSDWEFVPLVEIQLPEPLLTDHGGGRSLDDIYARRPSFVWTRARAERPRATRALTAHEINQEVGWNKVPWLDPTEEVVWVAPKRDSLSREQIEAIGLAAMERYGLG